MSSSCGACMRSLGSRARCISFSARGVWSRISSNAEASMTINGCHARRARRRSAPFCLDRDRVGAIVLSFLPESVVRQSFELRESNSPTGVDRTRQLAPSIACARRRGHDAVESSLACVNATCMCSTCPDGDLTKVGDSLDSKTRIHADVRQVPAANSRSSHRKRVLCSSISSTRARRSIVSVRSNRASSIPIRCSNFCIRVCNKARRSIAGNRSQ
jgi:hypothetical protein